MFPGKGAETGKFRLDAVRTDADGRADLSGGARQTRAVEALGEPVASAWLTAESQHRRTELPGDREDRGKSMSDLHAK